MNKRGFLLGEQTLKMIIAVICILLLLGLLFGLYNMYNENKKLEKARDSLEKIQEVLDKGGGSVRIFEPQDLVQRWFIVSFNLEDSKFYDELPEQCDNSVGGCVCICKAVAKETLKIWNPDYSRYCNEVGVCFDYEDVKVYNEENERNIVYTDSEAMAFLEIKKEGDKFKIIKK